MTPFSLRERLLRVGGRDVAHLRDVGVLVERVVVDRELGVERLHLALRRHDQRVDLAEHRVGADEGVVQARGDRRDLLPLAGVVDPRAVQKATGVVGLEADQRIDVQAGERLGPLRGDFLDVDAALFREHVQGLLRAAIEGDREVVLLRDVRGLLDPELPDDVASDVEPEDLVRPLRRLVRAGRELDPAGLPAPARQHLGLDHDLAAELLRGGAGLLGALGETPVRHRDPEAAEELLALVLVEIHSGGGV